jgi:hypothetical protein
MVPVLAILVGCTNEQGFVFEPYLPPAERIASVPVYGGTMESATAIGGVVAADPEGDRLLRLVGDTLTEIDLRDNARPFRLHVEDTRAWVTLRGTGEIAAIDLDTPRVEWTTRVCLEPRGVTRSPAGPIVVVCAGGEIVEVDDDGAVLRLDVLDSDLRDVVAAGDDLLVSRFVSAEVLEVDPVTLEETTRTRPLVRGGVAWRMRLHDSSVFLLHQHRSMLPVDLSEVETTGADSAPYGSETESTETGTIVETVITELTGSSSRAIGFITALAGVRLGVDFVVKEDGTLAVADAGATESDGGGPALMRFAAGWMRGGVESAMEARVLETWGRASALALDVDGTLVLQSASPISLVRAEEDGTLLEDPPNDQTAAVRLFHASTNARISCASCHPEGLDDGRVWTFADDSGVIERRTMPLAGRILSRLPYHWDAAHADPHALMADTFVRRMGGSISPTETQVLFEWLDGLRHVRSHPQRPELDIETGRAAFTTAGCGDCHAGPAFTNNQRAFVGNHSEPAFKVPSLLGVGIRNDLLHDGCAYDLDERFGDACGALPDDHGLISRLNEDQIEALKAYLRTL